jgi:ATP-binding cassette, subfamily B, bacterial CvaB/MchF/RaxB
MNLGKALQFGFGRSLPVILQAEAAECGMACDDSRPPQS